MFWKNVKNDFLNHASIRARLTIYYSVTAFILITIIALVLYYQMINILHKADYQFLAEEAQTIQHFLHTKPNNLSSLKREILETPNNTTGSIYRYYVRLCDGKHKLKLETPGMNDIITPDQFSKHNLSLVDAKSYDWYTNHDINYLLLQVPIQPKDDTSGSIQIALDLTYQHSVIRDRKLLLFIILASALSAIFLGFVISNRGMRSLYVLTESVKKITVTSLNERINPKVWPKELRPLSTSFNHMLDRIETSVKHLKQFSSDLSHELRTPINNLIGQTEMTLTQPRSIENYQQALASNLEEFHHIAQLIENILFLARAENPHLDMQKSLINIHDEIILVCEYFQAMADDKCIKITCEGQGSLLANTIMFRRMINNLLSNSIKYTPQNGLISFFIKEKNATDIEISIIDNGIGIAPEHLPKVFDRFYRIDCSRSKSLGGIGLGLAIVKSIVELHHGTVTITSELDKGTSIILTFPK